MTVPYTFATAVGLVPASELDTNFAYVSNNVSTANTVVANAQPNITSVGILANLSVTGNVIAARLKGDGGNISNIQGANVSGAVANATYAVTANSATYSTNSIQANIANIANLVTGSNVSGSVAQANIANIANLIVGSNVSGQVANALIAGTVYTNAQPNITSVGTLTSLSTSGNISAVGNITGSYLFGNGSQLTGIAASYGNADVVNFLANGFGSNNISTTGNIALGNIVPAVGNSVIINANSNTWIFNGNTGNLTIPSNSGIRTLSGSNGNILLHPDGAGTVIIQGNTTGALLRVVGDEINSLNRIEVDTYGNVNNLGGAFTGTFSRGTPTVPEAVQDQDRLAAFTGKGYDGSVLTSPAAQITVDAVENWSPSNHGTHISFYTTPTNSTTQQEVMRLQDTGNLTVYNGNLILNSGGNITGANVITANAVSTTGNITGNNVSAVTAFQLPVYANTTIRDTAISSPTVGMLIVVGNTYQGYNGASWGNITLT